MRRNILTREINMNISKWKTCAGCEDTYLDMFETCPYCDLGVSKTDLLKMKRREWLDL